jgi:hypothetical protein
MQELYDLEFLTDTMKFNPLLWKRVLLHVPVTVLEIWRSGRDSGQVSIELPVTQVVQARVWCVGLTTFFQY